jgi:hypothetical protein
MERYCSTGQSPQRAVVPMEEEEEEEEEDGEEEDEEEDDDDTVFSPTCLGAFDLHIQRDDTNI